MLDEILCLDGSGDYATLGIYASCAKFVGEYWCLGADICMMIGDVLWDR